MYHKGIPSKISFMYSSGQRQNKGLDPSSHPHHEYLEARRMQYSAAFKEVLLSFYFPPQND
jgi:hypothetical protein